MRISLFCRALLFCGLFAIPGWGQSVGRSSASQDFQSAELPEYYLIEGSPANVTLDLSRVAVKFSASTKSSFHQASLANAGFKSAGIEELPVEGWAFVTPTDKSSASADLNALVLQALESPSVEFASPVLVQPDGNWMVVTPDVLVRFRPDYRKAGVAALENSGIATEVTEVELGGMDGAFKLHCDSRNGFEVLALANRMALDPTVEWAEPDMLASVTKDLTPNDPGWSSLWGLNNTGQGGGSVDKDMDCDLAWDITTGSADIKILVLDDGAQLNHPDLNLGGGADFTGTGTGGGPGNACDNHSTAVSGCVSAIINNSLGTIGSAPGCRVLTAKYSVSNVPCDGSGTFQYSWMVSALNWGQTQGARVSNNSNGFGYSSAIAAKYQDTYNAGMVHFASSGNDGTESIGFPGSLAVVNAVGAINRYGSRASFSSYGSEVAFVAPGQTIYTTDRTGADGYAGGNYTSVDGTSFSSPYAAGVAALLLSVDPSLTPIEVEDQLKASATDLGAVGFDIYYGHGLLNAYEAVAFAQFDLDADVRLGPAPMIVNFTGSTARPASSWSWDFGDGGTSTEQNPTHEYLAPGSYSVSSTIDAGGLPYTKTVTNMISLYADTLSFADGVFDGNNGRVDVSVHNYVRLSRIDLPVLYSGTLNIVYDSITVTGLRSSSLNGVLLGRDDASKRVAVSLQAPNGLYLEPGNGPVLSIWFHRPGASFGSNTLTVSPYSSYVYRFVASAGTYVAPFLDGSLTANCCVGVVGDANADGGYEPTIGDVSALISHLFISGLSLDCYQEADVNQSGGPTATAEDLSIGDVTALIDNLFITGTPLLECF